MDADQQHLELSSSEIQRQLYSIAQRFFGREDPGHTLQPTALVHEVWIQMLRQPDLRFESFPAFKAWASTAVRNILVDHARRKQAKKRTAPGSRTPLEGITEPADGPQGLDVLALEEALFELESLHPRSARVVGMRFFGGMTTEEVASLLGISTRTVRYDWVFARGWLHRRLGGAGGA